MITAYKEMFTRFSDFKGRSTRSAYWYAILMNFIVSLALGILAGLVDVLSILSTIYSVVLIIPGLSLTIRRLRDVGKNPWWILISFVPLVGAIILLVFLCKPSEVSAETVEQ